MLQRALGEAGVHRIGPGLPAPVRVKSGINGKRRPIHYLLNYSSTPATFNSPFAGTDLLTGKPVTTSAPLTLAAWDLVIIEE